MTVSHNAGADFAASELARMFVATPTLCYDPADMPSGLSATASYEPSTSPWPKADGLVSILESGPSAIQRQIAIEYKRPQEGVHGLLTAIGQAHGYIHKGYSGSAIVIPSDYSTHASPGEYVRDVLDHVSGAEAVGVFCYTTPDTSSATPFAGRIRCMRPMKVVAGTKPTGVSASTPKTQWVHMREGSTTRDAFFRFLQTAKRLSAGATPAVLNIPTGLVDAARRLDPSKPVSEFLSSTNDNKFISKVWRDFWFEWVATSDALTAWHFDGTTYSEPNAFTRIQKDDGTGPSQIWEGRAKSLKASLVSMLNAGTVNESTAWELFASGIPSSSSQDKQGVRARAHSYRQDLDSSLAQLGWIDADGYPTDSGYRYMSICERYGGANADAAIEYVGATLLQAGHYASFLHYVHRLSEGVFSKNPLEFSQVVRRKPVFNATSYAKYLAYLEDKLSNDLKVMRKVSGRARPRKRTPFQVELTLLRNYGFVSKTRYRLGVGIPINWEHVLAALQVEL